MAPEQRRHIIQAMTSRAGQWRTRVGIGVVAALVFFPLTGAVFAVVWAMAYGMMQAFEARFQPDGAWAKRLSDEHYAHAAVALLFVNNLLFGLFGAVEILSGSPIGLACGALLLGGAILNGVTVSPGADRSTAKIAVPEPDWAAT